MRVFAFVGGLIVLVLVTALVAPLFIDWNGYKDRFEAEASRFIGQPVRVAGNMSARILPLPSLQLNDVRIGPPEAAFMSADGLTLEAELAPFLSGEFRIVDMTLTNPVLTLDLDNAAALFSGAHDEAALGGSVTLDNARIINGTARFIDTKNEREWVADKLDLDVSADALTGPWRMVGDGTFEGTPTDLRITTGVMSVDGFSVTANIALPRQLVSGSVEGRLSANEQAAAPFDGTFTLGPLQGSSEQYRVDGLLAIGRDGIVVEEYRADFGDPANPYTINGTARIDGGTDPSYLLIATGNQVNMNTADGDTGSAQNREAVDLRTRISQLADTVSGLPLPPMAGVVQLDLPTIVVGDTTVRGVKLSARPQGQGGFWDIDQLEGDLPGRTRLEAAGTLRIPARGEPLENGSFEGRLLVASRQPSGLAAWLTGNVDDAIRKLPAAGIEADMSVSAQTIRLENMELAAGGSILSGSITREMSPDGASALDIVLSGADASAQTLRALYALVAGDGDIAWPSGSTLDLTLDLERPDISGITPQRLQTSLRARDQRYEIDRIIVDGLFGASISATGTVTTLEQNGWQLNNDITLIAPNSAQFVREIAGRYAGHPVADHFISIAQTAPSAFSDTQLTIVGAVQSNADGAREFSTSISGALGGGTVTATSTGLFNFDGQDNVQMNGEAVYDHPDAQAFAAYAGLGAPLVPTDQPGELAITFDTLNGRDFSTKLDIVAGDDTLSWAGALGFVDAIERQSVVADGQIALSVGDVEPWLLAQELVLPGTGLGTSFAVDADLTASNEQLALKGLRAQAGEARMVGELTRDKNGAVGGTLSSNFVDADLLAAWYLGSFEPPALDTPFSAPLHDNVELDVTVNAGIARFAGFELGNVAGRIMIDGGELRIDDLGGALRGGAINGSLSAQNTGGDILASAQVQLFGQKLSHFVYGDMNAVESDVALAVELSANGSSAAALIANLSGSGVANTGEITVRGIDPMVISKIEAGVDEIGFGITDNQILSVAQRSILGEFESVFPAASIGFSVINGKAQLSNISLANAAFSIIGSLEYDFFKGVRSGEISVDFPYTLEGEESLPVGFDMSFTRAADGAYLRAFDFASLTAAMQSRVLEQERQRVVALQERLLDRQRLRRRLIAENARLQEEARRAEEARIRAAIEEEARLREAERLEAERLEAKRLARAAAERERLEARQRQAERSAQELKNAQTIEREVLPPLDVPALDLRLLEVPSLPLE